MLCILIHNGLHQIICEKRIFTRVNRGILGNKLYPHTPVKDRQKDDGNKCWSFQASVIKNEAAAQNVFGYAGASVLPLVGLGVSL